MFKTVLNSRILAFRLAARLRERFDLRLPRRALFFREQDEIALTPLQLRQIFLRRARRAVTDTVA